MAMLKWLPPKNVLWLHLSQIKKAIEILIITGLIFPVLWTIYFKSNITICF